MTAFAPESSDIAGPAGGPDPLAINAGEGTRRLLAEYFSVDVQRRAGRRYGRFVGFAKLFLLTLAAAMIAAVVIWPQLRNDEAVFNIGPVRIEQEDVESLRVVNARISGSSAEGRPYAVTFDNASQTRKDADLVTLALPKADIVLRDESWLAVEAPSGRYHRENRVLELDDSVTLFHDSGLELRTGGVSFNLAKGTGAGYDPLEAQAPFGQLQAQGFRIREKTAVFHFVGPARAILFAAPGSVP